jgi:uncharacterized protein (TIGR03435 family)
MAVEGVFWFHPLVWWLGARLVEERERACDEEVVRLGEEPQVYAESILKVCEFYLASPVPCAAGVTGGEIKKRIEGIMTEQMMRNLSFRKKLLLTVVGALAVAGPIAVGLLNAPRIHAQSPAPEPVPSAALPAAVQASAPAPAEAGKTSSPAQPPQRPSADSTSGPVFEVASIKPANPTADGPKRSVGIVITPGRLSAPAATLRDLVLWAYAVKGYQVTGGPGWIASAPFYLEAKPSKPVTRGQLLLMLRSLLADRFKLAFHAETRQLSVYALAVAKNGPKFRTESAPGGGNHLGFVGLSAFVDYLNLFAPRPVIDKTGLTWNSRFYLDTGRINVAAAETAGGPPSMGDTFQATAAAMEDQAGLKLTPTKAPIEVLVIDHAERPTEN